MHGRQSGRPWPTQRRLFKMRRAVLTAVQPPCAAVDPGRCARIRVVNHRDISYRPEVGWRLRVHRRESGRGIGCLRMTSSPSDSGRIRRRSPARAVSYDERSSTSRPDRPRWPRRQPDHGRERADDQCGIARTNRVHGPGAVRCAPSPGRGQRRQHPHAAALPDARRRNLRPRPSGWSPSPGSAAADPARAHASR
jgi:hypothetical protein